MTEKRKVLGRGLDSLLPPRPFSHVPPGPSRTPGEPSGASGAVPLTVSDMTPPGHVPGTISSVPGASGEAVQEIPTERVQFSPFQPRKVCDEERLNELASSMEEVGLVQPIVVRPKGDGGYELIAGERRLRAARLKGRSTIAAIVREASDLMSAEMVLLENLQREDLNPMEEAAAYQRLGPGGFHLTQEEIAKRTGKDRSTIANVLRLLKLPPEVQELIEQNKLSFGHAKALLALPPSASEFIVALARKVAARGLTVRQTEEAVAKLVEARPQTRKERIVDPNVREAEQTLQRALGVRVMINDRKGKGKIVLEYKSLEDFDRIVEAVTGK